MITQDLCRECERGSITIVRDLLDNRGANPNFSSLANHSKTALHVAAEAGRAEVVELLLRNGATVDPIDKFGFTPLMLACLQESSQRRLGTSKAAVSGLSTVGEEAILRGYRGVIQHLLNHSADSTAADHTGNTLVHIGASLGTLPSMLELLQGDSQQDVIGDDLGDLIEVKVSPNPVERCGDSQKRSSLRERDMTRLLDSLGAPGWGYLTPLHYACDSGRINTVTYLIEQKPESRFHVDIEARDACGWTPLHWAAKGGYVNVCMLLISHGASVLAEDFRKLRPSHLAMIFRHYYLSRLLHEEEGKQRLQNEALQSNVEITCRRLVLQGVEGSFPHSTAVAPLPVASFSDAQSSAETTASPLSRRLARHPCSRFTDDAFANNMNIRQPVPLPPEPANASMVYMHPDYGDVGSASSSAGGVLGVTLSPTQGAGSLSEDERSLMCSPKMSDRKVDYDTIESHEGIWPTYKRDEELGEVGLPENPEESFAETDGNENRTWRYMSQHCGYASTFLLSRVSLGLCWFGLLVLSVWALANLAAWGRLAALSFGTGFTVYSVYVTLVFVWCIALGLTLYYFAKAKKKADATHNEGQNRHVNQPNEQTTSVPDPAAEDFEDKRAGRGYARVIAMSPVHGQASPDGLSENSDAQLMQHRVRWSPLPPAIMPIVSREDLNSEAEGINVKRRNKGMTVMTHAGQLIAFLLGALVSPSALLFPEHGSKVVQDVAFLSIGRLYDLLCAKTAALRERWKRGRRGSRSHHSGVMRSSERGRDQNSSGGLSHGAESREDDGHDVHPEGGRNGNSSAFGRAAQWRYEGSNAALVTDLALHSSRPLAGIPELGRKDDEVGDEASEMEHSETGGAMTDLLDCVHKGESDQCQCIPPSATIALMMNDDPRERSVSALRGRDSRRSEQDAPSVLAFSYSMVDSEGIQASDAPHSKTLPRISRGRVKAPYRSHGVSQASGIMSASGADQGPPPGLLLPNVVRQSTATSIMAGGVGAPLRPGSRDWLRGIKWKLDSAFQLRGKLPSALDGARKPRNDLVLSWEDLRYLEALIFDWFVNLLRYRHFELMAHHWLLVIPREAAGWTDSAASAHRSKDGSPFFRREVNHALAPPELPMGTVLSDSNEEEEQGVDDSSDWTSCATSTSSDAEEDLEGQRPARDEGDQTDHSTLSEDSHTCEYRSPRELHLALRSDRESTTLVLQSSEVRSDTMATMSMASSEPYVSGVLQSSEQQAEGQCVLDWLLEAVPQCTGSLGEEVEKIATDAEGQPLYGLFHSESVWMEEGFVTSDAEHGMYSAFEQGAAGFEHPYHPYNNTSDEVADATSESSTQSEGSTEADYYGSLPLAQKIRQGRVTRSSVRSASENSSSESSERRDGEVDENDETPCSSSGSEAASEESSIRVIRTFSDDEYHQQVDTLISHRDHDAPLLQEVSQHAAANSQALKMSDGEMTSTPRSSFASPFLGDIKVNYLPPPRNYAQHLLKMASNLMAADALRAFIERHGEVGDDGLVSIRTPDDPKQVHPKDPGLLNLKAFLQLMVDRSQMTAFSKLNMNAASRLLLHSDRVGLMHRESGRWLMSPQFHHFASRCRDAEVRDAVLTQWRREFHRLAAFMDKTFGRKSASWPLFYAKETADTVTTLVPQTDPSLGPQSSWLYEEFEVALPHAPLNQATILDAAPSGLISTKPLPPALPGETADVETAGRGDAVIQIDRVRHEEIEGGKYGTNAGEMLPISSQDVALWKLGAEEKWLYLSAATSLLNCVVVDIPYLILTWAYFGSILTQASSMSLSQFFALWNTSTILSAAQFSEMLGFSMQFTMLRCLVAFLFGVFTVSCALCFHHGGSF